MSQAPAWSREDGGVAALAINVQSLRNKYDEIQVLIAEQNYPDIIILTEIWIKPHEQISYNIDGYNMYAISEEKNAAGGVAIYVSKQWSSATLKLLCDFIMLMACLCLWRLEEYGFMCLAYIGRPQGT
jgi:hypothetical protein